MPLASHSLPNDGHTRVMRWDRSSTMRDDIYFISAWRDDGFERVE